jgi:hypothetical protein
MKLYLAGDCNPNNDWRGYFSRDTRSGQTGDDHWDALRMPLWNDHYVTGPYPVGCDHGCAHKAAGFQTLHVAQSCNTDELHALRNRCFKAVRDANVVFAYINREGLYGTCAEIAYAYAHRKPIWVCLSPDVALANNPAGEYWFICQMASKIVVLRDPLRALKLMERGAGAEGKERVAEALDDWAYDINESSGAPAQASDFDV